MVRRQKICAAVGMILFASALLISEWSIPAMFVLLAGAGLSAYLGGLDQKRTSVEEIRKEYKI